MSNLKLDFLHFPANKLMNLNPHGYKMFLQISVFRKFVETPIHVYGASKVGCHYLSNIPISWKKIVTIYRLIYTVVRSVTYWNVYKKHSDSNSSLQHFFSAAVNILESKRTCKNSVSLIPTLHKMEYTRSWELSIWNLVLSCTLS